MTTYRATVNRATQRRSINPPPSTTVQMPWMAKTLPTLRTPWIADHQPLPDARLRLFCFPHAGGGASHFRHWAELLEPYQVEVCPVQLPGRENRTHEQPYNDLKRLVADLQKALEPYTDLPFAFLGHDLGALIAFHLAQRFQQRARPLQRLLVSAATPPRLCSSQRSPHRQVDGAFLQEMARQNGFPAEVLQNRELMAQLLPTLRADFVLSERAAMLSPTVLHCPLSVFTNLHEQRIRDEGLEQWRQHTIGLVKVRKFPGDHFFLYKQSTLVVKAIVQDLFSIAL